jgi:hypothetical protein
MFRGGEISGECWRKKKPQPPPLNIFLYILPFPVGHNFKIRALKFQSSKRVIWLMELQITDNTIFSEVRFAFAQAKSQGKPNVAYFCLIKNKPHIPTANGL